jgi:hypothetical protein
MTTALARMNAEERKELEDREKRIEAGVETFMDVGLELLAIRDKRLYRETHGTFEEYCAKRWGFSRMQGHRLIEAAVVSGNLSPIGYKGQAAPTHESQLRPLTKLPTPEAQREAWSSATAAAAAEGRPVTARHVEAAVDRVTGPKPARAPAQPKGKDESYVLSEMKDLYREASARVRKAFREWIQDREASARHVARPMDTVGSEMRSKKGKQQ